MAIKHIPSNSKWRIVSSSAILDPKHAVKELLDNGIDAGAANMYIDIDARTSGCQYISVKDDGAGVAASDRASMCLNYSTSKISSIGDLSHLTSLGFRGQALFALATLANQKGSMLIATRTSSEKVGEKWFVDKNGVIKENTRKKTPCPSGTTIVLRNLLLGLRARYMHVSARAPKNNEDIHRLIDHYSLNFRSVRFHFCLISVEKTGVVVRRQLQGSLDTNLSRVRALSAIVRSKTAVSESFMVENDLIVTDLICLDVILPNRQFQNDIINPSKARRFFSVNNRPMSLQLAFGRTIRKIVDKVYRNLRLPDPLAWYINLKCDTEIIDINLEPGKDDVMIRDMDFISDEIELCLNSYISKAVGLEEINNHNGLENTTSNTPTGLGKEREMHMSEGRTPLSKQKGNRSSFNENDRQSIQTRGGNKNFINAVASSPSHISNVCDGGSTVNATPNMANDSVTLNGGRWKRRLILDECTSSQQFLPSNHSPSLAHNREESQNLEEEVILLKGLPYAEPFMTKKLRRVDATERPDISCRERFESLIEGGDVNSSPGCEDQLSVRPEIKERLTETAVFEEALHNGKSPRNQPEINQSFSLNDNTHVCEGEEDQVLEPSRNIRLLSEKTRGLRITAKYDVVSLDKDAYKQELKWLARDANPAQRLSKSLSHFSDVFKNRRIALSRSSDGCFVASL